ncbi:MAG TPA: wax ester/triacylglycerol synthase domain-containing protein [Candidatus Binatia bacterium]|nr:wax ester/triacylglycerol synthase domain-containing protein [Candidatus Binatia bacterium]
MSDSDALMWFIENDPGLRSTITTVTLLDRAPDLGRLREKIAQATQLVPRLRERVAANPFSIAPPRWEPDPDFDLSRSTSGRSARSATDRCASCSTRSSRSRWRASTARVRSGRSGSSTGSAAAGPQWR